MADETHDRTEGTGGVVLLMPSRSATSSSWEPWLDEWAIARHYGVSTRTIRRWRAGGMPSGMFGGVRRYRLSDCDRWHQTRAPA